MLKSTIIVTVICFCTTLFGQNLVPNPSFEGTKNQNKRISSDKFPHEKRSGHTLFKNTTTHWSSATLGTPDLRQLDESYHKSCLSEFQQCDQARTGKYTMGIITYMENAKARNNREYIQVKLKERLIPGKTAYVELWIRNDRWTELVSNNIGFYFSMKQLFVESLEQIKVKPQFNYDKLIRRDDEWVQIKGSFVPDMPYLFVTIGNFFANEQTKVDNVLNYQGGNKETVTAGTTLPPIAYYQIDDVAVYHTKPIDTPPTPAPTPKPAVNTFKEKPITVGTTIELKNVEFDTNSDNLKPSSHQELSELINWLQSAPTVKIEIQGHTDNVGSDVDNLKLSVNRSKRIFDYLINKGIQPNRLTSKGFGESRPIADNSSEDGRKRNRRVEFIVLSK